MRILLITFFLLNSMAFSFSDPEIKSLMSKYGEVMSGKSQDLEGVFSEHFLKEQGGKESYSKKIASMKTTKSDRIDPKLVSWKKGLRRPMAFVKVTGMSSQFIVIEENKKLKIDGTLTDED